MFREQDCEVFRSVGADAFDELEMASWTYLENPVLSPDVSESPNVFKGKRESDPTLIAEPKVGLHKLQAQPVTVRIIANLSNRLLEK